MSFVALVGLAACTGYSYLEGSGSLIAARPALRGLWLDAAVVFGVAAAAVGTMFGVDTYRAGRGRALRVAPTTVLFLGVGVFLFGLIAFVIANAESYGRLPDGSGYAALIAYVAASQLVFALGFLGHRTSARRVDSGARVLAAAHGLVGMGWGFVLAYLAVTPPNWVT